MYMPQGIDQLERMSDGLPKAGGVIAHDRKTAAPFGAIRREGGDNGETSNLQTS